MDFPPDIRYNKYNTEHSRKISRKHGCKGVSESAHTSREVELMIKATLTNEILKKFLQ